MGQVLHGCATTCLVDRIRSQRWRAFTPRWMCFSRSRFGPESFGLVAREAQAQGLWVVASSRGAPSVNASSMERTVS
jgi:hypothetical protein